MFAFRLAHELHARSVKAMLRGMSSTEFLEWQAYFVKYDKANAPKK